MQQYTESVPRHFDATMRHYDAAAAPNHFDAAACQFSSLGDEFLVPHLLDSPRLYTPIPPAAEVPAPPLADVIRTLVQDFRYPELYTNIPLYRGEFLLTQGAFIYRHTVRAGETLLDMLHRIHAGGPIYTDCVALAYVVADLVAHGVGSAPHDREFFVVRNPRVEMLPPAAIALRVITRTDEYRHVVYALPLAGGLPRYIHVSPRSVAPVVDTSLADACGAVADSYTAYTYMRVHSPTGTFVEYNSDGTVYHAA